MPIPALPLPKEELGSESHALVLYKGGARPPYAPFLNRALAHVVDLGIVWGLSAYVAKLSTVLLISYYLPAAEAKGRAGAQVYQALYQYGATYMNAASGVAFAMLYFIALPVLTGRTVGLGLFGLSVESAGGGKPTVPQAMQRFSSYCISVVLLGLPLWLNRRGLRLYQDTRSGTEVVMHGKKR